MKLVSLLLLLTFAFIVSCEHFKRSNLNLKKEGIKSDYSVKFSPISKKEKKIYFDSIQFFFKKYIAYRPFHGHFLVAKNGQVIFQRYLGIANHEKNIKIGRETPIHVASISKVITSIAILRLVQNNTLKLEQTVDAFFPTFPFKNIRILDLLNHRSGLPYYGYFPEKTFKDSTWVKNSDIVPLLIRSGVIPYFNPNTHFSYCNTNYAILASIVEKVTKTKFPIWIQKDIFEPLKMTNSFVFAGDTSKLPSTLSYNQSGKKIPWDMFDGIFGDKNVYTTAPDLLKLSNALFSDVFLSKNVKKKMFTGYSYEQPGVSNYGLGVRMREAEGKQTFYFHTGWWHGFTGCFVHLPKDTVTMIAISNHWDRNVYGINYLSRIFGNYPVHKLTDPKENFVSEKQQKRYLKRKLNN
jgi:CubicO group peptidase (beta-lactamase class C family)